MDGGPYPRRGRKPHCSPCPQGPRLRASDSWVDPPHLAETLPESSLTKTPLATPCSQPRLDGPAAAAADNGAGLDFSSVTSPTAQGASHPTTLPVSDRAEIHLSDRTETLDSGRWTLTSVTVTQP